MILSVITLSSVLAICLSVTPGTVPGVLNSAEEHVSQLWNLLAELRKIVRPQDCSDLFRAGQMTSGVYTIFPTQNSTGRVVFCDMETQGGGWTVIQRRGQFGNNVYYFYNNWTVYANGFGDPREEYWIGNDALYALTSEGRTMLLRIELTNTTGDTLVVQYSPFAVASEEDFFRLTIGNYTGPTGSDAFSYANGANFSTFDRDHDAFDGSCAERYRGGWWYTSCHNSNLNGLNLNGPHDSFADGIEWSHVNNQTGLYHFSYPAVELKIRPVPFAPTTSFLPTPLSDPFLDVKVRVL